MSREALLAVINSTADKTANSRERKQKKGTATGYISIWNTAMMDFFPEELHLAPTLKTSAMMMRALTRLPCGIPEKTSFIRWVIANWKVNASMVPWKRGEYPETPDMKLFVYGVDKLYNSYCRKDKSKVVSAAQDNSKRLLEKRISELELVLRERDRDIARLNEELTKKNARIKLLASNRD